MAVYLHSPIWYRIVQKWIISLRSYCFRPFRKNSRKATISFVMSICLSVSSSGTIRLTLNGFSLNFMFEDYLKICRENSKFHWYLTRITGTLHENKYTFLIIPCSFLLRMTNFSHKRRRENRNTHFIFNYFCFEDLFFYETTWKKYCTHGQTTRRQFNTAQAHFVQNTQS
jgi:hypothetical protein